ncbi:Phage integrase family protein [compost metagenome]
MLYSWNRVIDFCINKGEFTFPLLHAYIQGNEINPREFHSILFGIKILCQEDFPGFGLDEYEELAFIPRPFVDKWGVYQDIDNILDPLEKNMIVNGLFSMAKTIQNNHFFEIQDIIDAAILGLIYATGARPVQISNLAVRDIRKDTHDVKNGLERFSVLLPYAKKRQLKTERIYLALPPEIGAILFHYIERSHLKLNDKLFEMGNSSPAYVSQSINNAIIKFGPVDFQNAAARGEATVTITPTDMRHNVGHSLAMQGVSAEEIANILGHSSVVVAKNYILATPALALIRAKALGVNPVWQNMIAMMLTGELTTSSQWKGRRVASIVGNELHSEIGGCSRGSIDGECPFAEVRCCYGCLYYRPFIDGDHQMVLDCVNREVEELIELSDSVGNSRNPLISVHETTQIEIESVITRCQLHSDKGGVL